MIIKTESIYKSYKNAKLEGLGAECRVIKLLNYGQKSFITFSAWPSL
jgi:hypothetical protein